MQPEAVGDARRLSWKPSAPWGARAAIAGLSVAAFMYFAAFVAGTDGLTEWMRWTDLVLLALSCLGAAVAWAAGCPVAS